MQPQAQVVDGRRARGDRSRSAIMRRAVDLASVDGLEGLTIGSLAMATGVSKSGVVALFGTKEQLQLATVAAAREVFVASVITPALAVPGRLDRLRTLIELWIGYSETRVFAGGCFFAAATAEFGARKGPVRDAIAESMNEWHSFVETAAAKAVQAGELAPEIDPAQIAFELTAILDGANRSSLLLDSSEPYARARVAAARILRE